MIARFFATLYGYEMDSKALISDFIYLLNHIKKQQAEIDTLSMAHDDMHRLIDRDKHFLIKSNIALNRKVQELEEELTEQEERYKELFCRYYRISKTYSGIKNNYIKECNQNKLYRKAIELMNNAWTVQATYEGLANYIAEIIEALECEQQCK